MARRRTGQARSRRRDKAPRKPLAYWLRPVFVALVVGSSLGGLALMVEWMKDPRAWPVRTVRIEGELRYLDRPALQAFLAPMTADGFFGLRVADIQARLQARPWIDRVSVRRVWPDQVEIRVREQQPVARWGGGGFLNPRGEVFRPDAAEEIPGLPELSGPDGHARRVLDMYAKLRATLQPLRTGIARLQLDARRAWHIRLDDGLQMELGRRDPLRRVARLVRAWPAIMATGNGRMVSVDLRYSNGVAVHWQTKDIQAEHTG